MIFMKTATELGSKTYSGTTWTCTGSFTYTKLGDFNEMTDCNSAGPGYSFKGFKSTLSAFLKKYSSVNGLITLNYATRTCSGQYPTIDITIFEPCMPITGDNQATTGYVTMTLIPTGLTQNFYDVANSNCTGTPVMSLNRTYAELNFGNTCTPTEDRKDNYKFNIQTTHFLMH